VEQASARAQSSDSLDLLRQAHAAQREFERVRRSHLPYELGVRQKNCDERIGRYCYWYEPMVESAPAEVAPVRVARESLLVALQDAHQQLPGDGWITGQLVRYLAEEGFSDSAIATARSCTGLPWWCHALEGLARHRAHDYQGAEAAFSRALREMPAAERCAWTDLGPLLGDGERLYRSRSCTARDSVNERIWWLARPLYSRPGNDLETEHYSRHTMALLLQYSATPDGGSWGDDRRRLGVRFGWPTHWSKREEPGALEPFWILGHEPGPSFWLFPAPALTEPWSDQTETRWDAYQERPPSRYAPPYATGFVSIERVQFARFARRDTTLTVAVFDLASDSIFATHPADARLAVARDPATPILVGRIFPATPRAVLSVRSAWRPAVLSLEALGVDTPWVARRRAMAPLDPGGSQPTISDLLLFAPTDLLPRSLEATLPAALSGSVVRRGQRLGLFWEMYQESDSAATIEIAVTPKAGSKGEAPYPIGRPSCPFALESPVRLRWVEERRTRPIGPARSVALDLGSLSEGRYVVTIQLSWGSRVHGCSSREFRVASSNR
jgi:hypothetical protein